MNSSINAILIIGSLLLFVSILTSKLSARTGVPTILVFILIGMLAGSDGLGGISFDNYKVANVLGSITITLILFLGGLDTNFNHIRPVIWSSILLSTVGVLITTFSIGFFIHYVTDLSMLQGLLMGSIISSTDAAAVFSILRSKNINLKYNLAPTLEIESGSNDIFLDCFFYVDD